MDNINEKGGFVTPIEMILDSENTDNITLYDEEGDPIEFEQIAVVPYEGKVYVLLSPVPEVDEDTEREAWIFVIDDLDGEEVLTLVAEDEIADQVFELYEAAVNEE